MLLCRLSDIGGAGCVKNVNNTALNKAFHVTVLFTLSCLCLQCYLCCVLHRFYKQSELWNNAC